MRQRLTEYEFDFMKNKNDSYISALILQRMVFERSLDYDKADSIMDNFDENIKLTSPFLAVKKIIENFRLSNTEAPVIGSFAPKFSGPGLDGEVISLYGIKSKYILIDFWASWCAPCITSLPLYNELYDKYKDNGLEVIAINVDNPIEDGLDFLLDTPLDFLIPQDPEGDAAELFGVIGMPSSYLVSPDGNVELVHMGFRNGDINVIEEEIKKVLQEN